MAGPAFIHYRTPGILIFGMVLAPCGWVLDLISTVAPNWRTISNLPSQSSDKYYQQGIWDICLSSTISQSNQCGQQDQTYFSNQIITVARGMMVGSLVVTLIGLAVATPGVRCWSDRPRWVVASLGGLLIFCSGVLTIIPIAWYTYLMKNMTAASTNIQVGYCIVLGYIGGIMEVLGGFVMFLGVASCCGGRNRSERKVANTGNVARRSEPPRRVAIPSVVPRSRSEASSVPYSKDSMEDESDFPRAKPRVANPPFAGRPYDADL